MRRRRLLRSRTPARAGRQARGRAGSSGWWRQAWVMGSGKIVMDGRALIAGWPARAPRGSVTRFCREHGISRSWFYELRRRSVADPAVGVLTRSRRPNRSPSATSALLEDLVVRGRKQLQEQGWDAGPLSIQAWM